MTAIFAASFTLFVAVNSPAALLTLPTSPKGRVIAWGYGETNVPQNLSNVVAISAGYSDSFAIRADHTATNWRVGISLTNVITVVPAGNYHLVLKDDGTVFRWEDSDPTQLSFPSENYGVSRIAAGYHFQLALRTNGTLLLWGSVTNIVEPTLAQVSDISVGDYHVLFALRDGSVVQRSYQQYPAEITPPPPGLSNVIAVAAGAHHSLALRENGTVTAWGRNVEGQCSVPPGLSNVVAIAASGYHNLALKRDRTIVAWGDPSYGLNASPDDLTNIVGIACGWFHNVVLQAGPRFTSTPSNLVGSLGHDFVLSASAQAEGPVTFQWFHDGVALPQATNEMLIVTNAQVANAGTYAIAAATDGFTNVASSHVAFGDPPTITQVSTSAWVFDYENASFHVIATGASPIKYQWVRDGSDIPNETNATLTLNAPLSSQAGSYAVRVRTALGYTVTVPAYLHLLNAQRWGDVVSWGWNRVPEDLTAVSAISANGLNTLALRLDGTLAAWGDAGITNIPAGLSDVVAVAAGVSHSLALRRDGTIVGWGANFNGQASPPSDIGRVAAIAAGNSFSVAARENGTVLAWGNVSCSPEMVPSSATNVVSVAAGDCHVVALRRDGTIVAWGGGLSESEQTVLNSIAGASGVAAGHANTIVTLSNGTLLAFGTIDPDPVVGFSDSAAVAVNYEHGIIARSNGTVLAWGANDYGQSNPPEGLTNVFAVAADERTSIAVVETGCFIPPQNVAQTTYVGSNATIAINIKTVYPIQYQWFHNGTLIPYATNEKVSIENAQFSDAGNYTLLVSNSFGATISKPAALTVLPVIPTIIEEPQNAAVALDGTLNLAVAAIGVPDFAYQWFFNGNLLREATNRTLSITNFSERDTGVYSALVRNSAGFTFSSNAIVTLLGATVIIDNTQALIPNSWLTNYESTMYATDYRLHRAFAASSFARFATRLLRPGDYLVSEWHPGDTLFTSPAVIHVIEHLNGTNIVIVNQRTNFSRWNALGIYAFSATTDAAVSISDAAPSGFWVSADAVRFDYQPKPPRILLPPSDCTVAWGTTAVFDVEVASDSPLRVQWRKDGENIPGATNLFIEIPRATSESQGLYSALVISIDGAAFSAPASLSVVLPSVSLRYEAGRLVLEWTDGILQTATNVAGPFWDVPSAMPPYVTEANEGASRFFRVRH